MKLLVVMLIVFSICGNHQNDPGWVGYECITEPRTKGIQGEITKEFIGLFLPEDPVILEAGAYNGEDTIEMSKLWPKGKIYAFEPVPSLFNILSSKVRSQINVYVYKQALSDQNGSASFNLSSGGSDGSSSLLKPKEHLKFHPSVVFNETIDVETITLDTWAEDNKIDKIDFLWLDLQGFEPRVLRASKKILNTVKAILTEVNFVETYEGLETYTSFKNWLITQGFKVVREDLPWRDGGNVLFIRK